MLDQCKGAELPPIADAPQPEPKPWPTVPPAEWKPFDSAITQAECDKLNDLRETGHVRNRELTDALRFPLGRTQKALVWLIKMVGFGILWLLAGGLMLNFPLVGWPILFGLLAWGLWRGSKEEGKW